MYSNLTSVKRSTETRTQQFHKLTLHWLEGYEMGWRVGQRVHLRDLLPVASFSLNLNGRANVVALAHALVLVQSQERFTVYLINLPPDSMALAGLCDEKVGHSAGSNH